MFTKFRSVLIAVVLCGAFLSLLTGCNMVFGLEEFGLKPSDPDASQDANGPKGDVSGDSSVGPDVNPDSRPPDTVGDTGPDVTPGSDGKDVSTDVATDGIDGEDVRSDGDPADAAGDGRGNVLDGADGGRLPDVSNDLGGGDVKGDRNDVPDRGSDVEGGVVDPLTSISITPANPSVPKGAALALHATGHYPSSPDQDLTALVTWSSATPSIAAFDTTPGHEGIVTGQVMGSVEVSAKLSNITGKASLSVGAPTVSAIEITPDQASIPAGTSLQFHAQATYTDGTKGDITETATWSVSADPLATVSNAAGSRGLVTGVAKGGPFVLYAAVGSVEGSVNVVIATAVLTRIDISPPAAKIQINAQQVFTVKETYSDNTTRDSQASALWLSSNTSIATISNGTAAGLAQGVVTIIAQAQGFEATATLTVGGATPTRVDISPDGGNLPAGTTTMYTATLTWSDATMSDVSQSATWSSSNAGVATVSTTGTRGVVTAVASGQATISVTLSYAAGQTLTDTMTVNVQ